MGGSSKQFRVLAEIALARVFSSRSLDSGHDLLSRRRFGPGDTLAIDEPRKQAYGGRFVPLLRWRSGTRINGPDLAKPSIARRAASRNPERVTALAQLRSHEQTVTELEQKIGQHHTTPTPTDTNAAQTLCMLQADLHTARADTRAAKATLKPIPAKLPANVIDPDAQRATPRVNRRALQTVCRLLAYNAELDLARAINTYLQDPNEYRAITRHLLHQPGHIHYTPDSITVTIDQPHAPRNERALKLLIDQINTPPPKLAGDHRKITYSTSQP